MKSTHVWSNKIISTTAKNSVDDEVQRKLFCDVTEKTGMSGVGSLHVTSRRKQGRVA
jgi:hypothetical protein